MGIFLLALLAAAPGAGPGRVAASAVADAPVKESGRRELLAPVAVGTDAAGRAVAPRLQALAADAVGRSDRFQAVDLVEALDPERAAAREKSRAGAEAALAEAEKAYNDLDTQRAAKLADAAVKAFARADLSRAWAGYVRARVLKAACLAANGKTRPARSELERLMGVAPDAELPAAQFAPDLLAFARRARRAALARATQMEVRTVPEGAEVWVDGKLRGPSPVAVRGLGAGEHYLTLRAPGTALHQKLASGAVEVWLEPAARQALWTAVEQAAAAQRAGGAESGRLFAAASLAGAAGAAAQRAGGAEPGRLFAAASLEGAAEAHGPGSSSSALLKAAAALGEGVGAAQVLLVIASGADRPGAVALEVIRLDANGARVLASAREILPTGERLGDAALSLMDRALGPDAVVLAPPLAAPAPSSALAPAALQAPGQPFTWTQTHTGLGLIGGGAVLAGAGGFFGYQAMVKQGQLRTTAQTDPASQQLAARGQLYALLADALFASALAAGVAGGYLAFFAPGPEPGPR